MHIIKRLFIDHPASVGQTYWQHMGFAVRVAALLVAAGCAALVHGFLPFLFKRTASNRIVALYDTLAQGNGTPPPPDVKATGSPRV